MRCVICEEHLRLEPTDCTEYSVCAHCNAPYHKGEPSFTTERGTSMKEYLAYLESIGAKSINVCPGAFTLSDSEFDVTMEEDWKNWNDWYILNKDKLPKLTILISADRDNFSVTRV